MPAPRSALRTVTVLTLTPARRNNSRVTSSSEERGCSWVIARNIVVCSAFSEGLRPGRPGSPQTIRFSTSYKSFGRTGLNSTMWPLSWMRCTWSGAVSPVTSTAGTV